MGKKKGRSVKRNVQANNTDEPEELKRAPHSFVLHRGSVGNNVMELTRDFRKVMEPFTASALKARKRNSIKDFVSVSGLLHVSHICIFTSTELGTYLKIARLPQGPTLTFWVRNFSLARDVVSSMKKQFVFEKLYQDAPLIVLNNFSGEGLQMKLMASMFQNMFPTINVTKIKLSSIRRCALINYNTTSKLIDFRHYAIKAVPVGLSKGVKKLVQSKVPDLGRFQDMSDFISKSGQLSESEAEDDPESHVTLPQKLSSRGNMAFAQSALRLKEIGPRLTLQLKKIEDGLMTGEVLFHEIVTKSEEEKLLIKKRRDQRRKLKEKRRKIQEENVKNKAKLKEELKKKSLKGMHKKSENEIEMQKAAAEVLGEAGSDQDDDNEWYRQEVGQEPDRDLFDGSPRKQEKRKQPSEGPNQKRRKVENGPKYRNNKERNSRNQNEFGNNAKYRNKEDRYSRNKNKFENKNAKYRNKNDRNSRNRTEFGNKTFSRGGKVKKNNHFQKRKVFGSKLSNKKRH